MAQPTASHSSYDAIGNREDLSDLIDLVAPTKTPVKTALKKTTATSTKHEWQTHDLAAAAENFVIEGDDATTDAASVTARVFNYTGISDKVARVTGTQESLDSAGRASEMAFQKETKMKELCRDVETMILANVAYVAGNDTLARKVAGAQAWITTNTSVAGDATASTGDGSDAHTDGTARALQESFFTDALGTAWDNGGEPTMGVMGKAQKLAIAGFNGNATRTEDGTSKKITNTVDIYIDPLGNEVRMVPDQFCPTDVVYFLDLEHMALATLPGRDAHSVKLAKTGDTEREQIIMEWTLEVGNEEAHAGIFDLT